MSLPAITLTTDFGAGSPYVAAMKGVILRINPEATIVDITHQIPPQDVRAGALVLAETTPHFAAGTIHVAVVDPGVGTARRLIYARFGEQQYLAPDNGLLSGLARSRSPSTIIDLDNPRFWSATVSATFHGRDILAPVAANLSLGVSPSELGRPQNELIQLDWPEVSVGTRRIEGAVESIDSFGNLVTNITSEMLADAPRDETVTIECDEHETQGIFRTYDEQPEMTLIALVGSAGKLELAIVRESAAAMLSIRPGAKVTVKW